jgi:hypothetical protein
VLVYALSFAADFVLIAANAVADNARTATFAVETNGSCAAAAVSVTANYPVGAAFSATISQILATAHAVGAAASAAFPIAIDMTRRAADAIDANLIGAAAVRAADSLLGATLCGWSLSGGT